jgi:hypothetical protein
MNGRVYDPITGRFLSPDNVVQAPDNTQSFNRYSYCLNNPLKYTDPTGWSDESGTPIKYEDWQDYFNSHNPWYNMGPTSAQQQMQAFNSENAAIMAGVKEWVASQSEINFPISYNGVNTGQVINGMFFPFTLDLIIAQRVSQEHTENERNGGYSEDANGGFGSYLYNGNSSILQIVAPWGGLSGGGERNTGNNATSGEGGALDNGLDYAGRTNDAVDAFAKTLGTNGLTAVMVNSGKTIGRYSVPAGVVISAGQVYNGYKKDGNQFGYNAQKATAGTIGGMVGAWAGFRAGAWVGFESGFEIGLYFEGVGAIPGAIIGGIGGGLGGAYFGAYGGSKLGKSLISNKAR